MKFLKQIGYTIVGFLMFFGPGILGAYVLDYFGAPDWVLDIFVFAYVLFVFIILLTHAMSCHAFSPNRGGWID